MEPAHTYSGSVAVCIVWAWRLDTWLAIVQYRDYCGGSIYRVAGLQQSGKELYGYSLDKESMLSHKLTQKQIRLSAYPVGMQRNQTGMPACYPGMFTSQAGMLTSQTGMLASHIGMLTSQTGMFSSQTGMFSSQTGMFSSQTGMLSSQTGMLASIQLVREIVK